MIDIESQHSTMKLWMIKHRAEFAAGLRKAGRPNWVRIAATLADLGLLDTKGRKPTKSTARDTWRSIDDPKRQGKPKRVARVSKPIEPTSQPKPSQPIETGQDQDAEARLRHLKNQIARRSVR